MGKEDYLTAGVHFLPRLNSWVSMRKFLYDTTSWFYKKLVEANRNAEDSIVFEIVQAFDFHY